MLAKDFITEYADDSVRWGKPKEISLDNFILVPNTKLLKKKVRKIFADLKLVSSSKPWKDLEGGIQEATYYHMPNNKDDIVAIAKGSGSAGGFAQDFYVRTDIWDSF